MEPYGFWTSLPRLSTRRSALFQRIYCTFAVTDELLVIVKEQLCVSFPPLEHAPDQITVRPPASLRVILVPEENDADPVLPTATLMPAGLDVMRSPLRPVAVTVKVTV
jgi:hypothetical protein